jgi:hypothetical protein
MVEMHRIKFFLPIVTLFIVTQNAQAQWVQTGITGYDSVYCLLANGPNLYAGTDSGLYVSANNGANWNKVDSGLPNLGVSALAASGTNMFAGTDSGVYRSLDSGKSWRGVLLGYAHTIALAANGTVIYESAVLGINSYVNRSLNNGLSWGSADAGLPGSWVLAFLINGTTIFAGTQNGVYLSKDSGSSWISDTNGMGLPLPVPFYPWVYSFTMIGTNIFAGTTFGVYLRTDSSSSWNLVISGLGWPYSTFALEANGLNIFAAADSGIYMSSNNGTSWSSVSDGLPYGIHINTLTTSGGYLFAGTAGAGVWRRPLSEMISAVRDRPIAQTKMFAIYFTRNSTIRYILPEESFVSLKIFDIRGRLALTVINERQRAGEHLIPLPINRFSAGNYIVQLDAGNYKTQKIFSIVR